MTGPRNDELYAIVPGPPVGKARPRVTRRGVYTPGKTAGWEASAVWEFRRWRIDAPIEEPMRVEVVAVGKRPKRLYRKKDPPGRLWRCAKPDGDNVLKAVCDALVKAGVVRDDVCLCQKVVHSVYAARAENPRVEVKVRRIGETPCPSQ